MPENRILELRLYKLKPGTAPAFAARFRDQIEPMLARHGIAVVHCGPSLIDPDSWCLLRAYPSLEARQAQLDAFYDSDEWLEKHDAPVMAMIESYNTCVLDDQEQLVRETSKQLMWRCLRQ